MKNLSSLSFILFISFLTLSCAKESDSDSSVVTKYDNAMVNSTKAVNTSAAKLANLMDSSSSILESKRAVPNLATAWWDTTASMNNDLVGSGQQVTPKSWMGTQLDSDAVRENGSSVNVFGRIKGKLGIFCVVGIGLDSSNVDANGYPDNGTHTISFTAALAADSKSQCNSDIEDMVPFDATLTVTDAGGSIYDKKIIISLEDEDDQAMLVKVTSTITRLAYVEVYTHSNNVEYASRTVIDITDGVLRAEYMSGGTDEEDVVGGDAVAYFHRLYYSDDENIGVVGSFIYGTGDSTADNAYLLSGDPDAAAVAFSLSLYADGVDGDNVNTVCVNGSTGDITNEDNHCGGVNLSNFEFPSDTAAGLRAAWGGAGGVNGEFYSGDNYNTISNATTLSFTDETDFNSSVFSQN